MALHAPQAPAAGRAAPQQRAAAPPRSRRGRAQATGVPVVKRRKATVRRVTRVVRKVDAWSVCKLAVLFFITLYVVMLVAGVLLWGVVSSSGLLDNLENFIRKAFALDTFEFSGGTLFRASWVLGLVLVVAGTMFTVAITVFFNLLSDLTGGVRVTVLEEETQLVGTGTD